MRIKTSWVYNFKTEAKRVAYTLFFAQKSFYQKHGFLILPQNKKGLPHSVYLPALRFNRLPTLAQEIKKSDFLIPVQLSTKLKIFLVKELEKRGEIISEKWLTEIKQNWQKKEKKFFNTLSLLFPLPEKVNLTIIPTLYGTSYSFSPAKNKKGYGEFFVYLRSDQNEAGIAAAILLSLITGSHPNEQAGAFSPWEESQMIGDFLMTKTYFKKLFPDYQSTLTAIRKTWDFGQLIKKSKKHLNALGLTVPAPLSIKEKTIFINHQSTNIRLTYQENQILKALIQESPNLVNFEKIGDLLWKDESQFSLWAITKIIERIRKKLKKAGFLREVIYAQRGEGYCLR